MLKSKNFYKIARTIRDMEVLLSFNPKKILNRIGNKLLGRYVYRKMWIKTKNK